MILIIGKTVPGNPTTARPSEAPAPQANVRVESSAPPAGQSVISGPAKIEETPLKERVDIGSVGSFGYPIEFSRITLYSRLKEKETVNITGWKIKSNKSEAIIPQAVEIYEPAGFAPVGDIILKPDNYVEIYSSISPLNRNFRLNKCIGYLEGIYNFQNSLPKNCPSLSRSDIRYLSSQCQSYIDSLSPCQIPEVNFYNSLAGTDEGNACRSFLQNINYGSCFQSHQNDVDFLSNIWMVWLNQQQILDQRHDYLRLYDRAGNLIDEYSY